MPNYSDSGHRSHAIHTGEGPRNEITMGPESISVVLDAWGPQDNLFTSLYDALQSNWGDMPSRTVFAPVINSVAADSDFDILYRTGWNQLTEDQREYVESCFYGKTLPQVLESISFRFLIDGVSRAATHQLVRSRIGAAFMQHGGRDNDWRHRPFTIPETVKRACIAYDDPPHSGPHPTGLEALDAMGLAHCITNWDALDNLISLMHDDVPNGSLTGIIEDYLMRGRVLYAALVDAGIPWQDARRFLWTGQQSYLHADYNYLALKGVCARRLEHVMDWEINCVAQLMVREVRMKCPPIFGKYLLSMSDMQGKAAFAGLDSWPPDGKYPVPAVEAARPRMHRPEQNPFWVLHPDSMAGEPIRWVPTNGVYPKEF